VSYLVDSDVMIDYLTARADAVALLHRLIPDGIAISILTYAEVYQGIYRGYDPKATEQGFKTVLASTRLLAVSRTIARRGARIRGDLRARGQILPMIDILIAATALQHDLTLVTRNLRHYQRIPDLEFYQQSSNPI
jgi:tRNA(fMet)-specific endonuclease VapC